MEWDMNIKPIFLWAREKGDAKIYDRILMKVVPELVKNNIQLTSEFIEQNEIIDVPSEIYDLLLEKAQELVGEKYV
jgi:hypothetical protein